METSVAFRLVRRSIATVVTLTLAAVAFGGSASARIERGIHPRVTYSTPAYDYSDPGNPVATVKIHLRISNTTDRSSFVRCTVIARWYYKGKSWPHRYRKRVWVPKNNYNKVSWKSAFYFEAGTTEPTFPQRPDIRNCYFD